MPHIVPRILLGDPPIAYPHCYGSRWKRPLSHTATPAHVLVTYRATFTALREGEFIWCPYDAVMESLLNNCTNHSELWAYCEWMVYWNVAEPHVPNRVSRQFGYVQGEPEPLYVVSVREHMDNHKGNLTSEHGTNWLEKKGAEVDCWKYRHSHIYQLPGPAGGGVTPGYMQWFYECTVLLIMSPTAQNAPNVYPEWGGVQQTQNEALRQIHDRAQGAIDARVGNCQMWQEFVQIPRQAMEYGHNLDRMGYGSQQYSYPPPAYYPRPPSPQRGGGGYTGSQPQYGRQFEAGGSSYQYGQQFQSGGGSYRYGKQSQYQDEVGGSNAQNQENIDMINELLETTPTWLSLSPNLHGEQSNWAQLNYQPDPNNDMVARWAFYADNSPVQIQSFGDFGLLQNIDINQPPNEETDADGQDRRTRPVRNPQNIDINQPPNEETDADGQDRRTRPVRNPHPTYCGTGNHLLQQQPPRRR